VPGPPPGKGLGEWGQRATITPGLRLGGTDTLGQRWTAPGIRAAHAGGGEAEGRSEDGREEKPSPSAVLVQGARGPLITKVEEAISARPIGLGHTVDEMMRRMPGARAAALRATRGKGPVSTGKKFAAGPAMTSQVGAER